MPDLGRLVESLRSFVVTITKRLDYHALYPATVAAQAGNILEVVPDDERIKGLGVGGVAIRPGMPGYQVTVPAGARVLIGFEAGDPTRPYAALWDTATTVTELKFDGGTKSMARVDDAIDVGTITATVGAAPVMFIYTPPGALAQPVTAVLLLDDGKITSGNDKLKA